MDQRGVDAGCGHLGTGTSAEDNTNRGEMLLMVMMVVMMMLVMMVMVNMMMAGVCCAGVQTGPVTAVTHRLKVTHQSCIHHVGSGDSCKKEKKVVSLYLLVLLQVLLTWIELNDFLVLNTPANILLPFLERNSVFSRKIAA